MKTPLKSYDILVVEDNKLEQVAYQARLNKIKAIGECFMVSSVKEAKEQIATKKFKLALVDYQLTDGTGFELLPLLEETLVVFITGEGDLSVAVKAMKNGVYDFIVKDKDKEYLGIMHEVIGRAVDKIIQKEQLEKAEKTVTRLSTALSQIDNSVLMFDCKGNLLWNNAHYAKKSEYDDAELKQLNATELYKRKAISVDVEADYFKTLWENKESTSFEHKNKNKSGGVYHVLTTLTPVFNTQGKIVEVVAVEVDITKQKEHETALLNAKLEAESSVRAKEQFLANMSHEIRTPMNAIMGMSQLMQDTRLSAKQKKYLAVMQESSNNLLTIINDILDFSKINAGKIDIECETFNLPQTLREVKNSFALRNAKEQVKFIFQIPSQLPKLVKGDANRIKQVLNNVLSNSFKFTHQGLIEVNCSLVGSNPSKNWIEFAIKDTGIGINDDAMPHIFEKFTQANASITREFGGTGLGLTIVKKLVQLMDGKVSMTSKVGEGTCTRVVIPLQIPLNFRQTHQIKTNLKNSRKEQLKGIRILLVEDNKMNQMLAMQYLKKQGAKVTLCENGKIAYQHYLEKDCDIVLMDLQMPVMGGIEATDLIRQSEKDKELRVPILAMTAHALQGDREHCLKHDMDEYIAKPIKLDELRKKILQLVRHNPPKRTLLASA